MEDPNRTSSSTATNNKEACDPVSSVSEPAPSLHDCALESKLVAQEHRLPAVCLNAWEHGFSKKNTPLRRAARSAMIWKLVGLFGATIPIAGVSLTALAGVAIAWRANSLFIEQNILLKKQNATVALQNVLIENQNQLSEAHRRSSLVFELSSILDRIDEELNQFGSHRPETLPVGIRDEPLGSASSTSRLEVPEPGRVFRLSSRLIGRIVALSRSLRPYRFIDDNGELTHLPLSPERAQLLVSLADSQIDMEDINNSNIVFDQADLRGVVFDQLNLSGIRLNNVNLSGATFNNCLMHRAEILNSNCSDVKFNGGESEVDFSGSDLTGVSFVGTDFFRLVLDGVVLDRANLAEIDVSNYQGLDRVKSATFANIRGIRNAPRGVEDYLQSLGAVNLSNDDWEIAIETSLKE